MVLFFAIQISFRGLRPSHPHCYSIFGQNVAQNYVKHPIASLDQSPFQRSTCPPPSDLRTLDNSTSLELSFHYNLSLDSLN